MTCGGACTKASRSRWGTDCFDSCRRSNEILLQPVDFRGMARAGIRACGNVLHESVNRQKVRSRQTSAKYIHTHKPDCSRSGHSPAPAISHPVNSSWMDHTCLEKNSPSRIQQHAELRDIARAGIRACCNVFHRNRKQRMVMAQSYRAPYARTCKIFCGRSRHSSAPAISRSLD
jgi:hypothetical protein